MVRRTILRIKEQKGLSAVEFAIVLPLMVLLLFGAIEFGILIYDKAVITNASREGARAGVVYTDPRVSDVEIIAVVDNYCSDKLVTFGSAASPSTTISRAGSNLGDPLTVRVDYQYEFLVLPSFMNSLLGAHNLSAETVMRME